MDEKSSTIKSILTLLAAACYEVGVARGMLSDTLGSRLQRAREEAGLSLRALAERASMVHSTVGDIEKGRHCPAVDTLERLAQALRVSPCWLAYGIGPQRTDKEP
jgi:transcriptional regulator with XRE-family HTH domain